MNTPRILFFGTPKIGEIILTSLIANNLSPIAVVTREDKPAGRGQKETPPPVKILALKSKIPVLQPSKLKENQEFFEKLRALKPDLGIVVAYGRIIPKEVLDIPKHGILNVHPSLLPKYRGASPIQSVILAGEKKTGVTIILLDEKLDHGSILAQKTLKIADNDTSLSLTKKLGELGAKILIEVISKWISGKIKLKEQDHKKATFTKMFKKEDGYIDPKNPPDHQRFQLMVRAFYPWPSAWTRLQISNRKSLIVKFLPGNLIQLEGKRPLTIKEFLNGYPDAKEVIFKLKLE